MVLKRLEIIFEEARQEFGGLYKLPNLAELPQSLLEGVNLVGVMFRLPKSVMGQLINGTPKLWPVHETIDSVSRYFFAKAQEEKVLHWWGIEPTGAFAVEGTHLILSSENVASRTMCCIEYGFGRVSHYQEKLPGLAAPQAPLLNAKTGLSIQFVDIGMTSWAPAVILNRLIGGTL